MQHAIHMKAKTGTNNEVRATGCPSDGVLNKIKITLHSELCLKNTQKWFNENSSGDSCNIRLHIYRMWISTCSVLVSRLEPRATIRK